MNCFPLQYETHDPNCERVLIYETQHWYGFGSQWNNMLLNYVSSLWESRALVMEDNWMVDYRCNEDGGDGTYASCFKSYVIGPQTCDVQKLREYAKHSHDYPMWECGRGQQEVKWCLHNETAVLHSHGVMAYSGYHWWKHQVGDVPTQIGDNMYDYFDLEVYGK